MFRIRRIGASARSWCLVGFLLISACTRTPMPWESPEGFYQRCMAGHGVIVTGVDIEIRADGASLSIGQIEADMAAFESANDRCWGPALERFGND